MEAARTIKEQKVTGSGGRPRTVWVCEMGCWHGSRKAAMRCKNALALVAK